MRLYPEFGWTVWARLRPAGRRGAVSVREHAGVPVVRVGLGDADGQSDGARGDVGGLAMQGDWSEACEPGRYGFAGDVAMV